MFDAVMYMALLTALPCPALNIAGASLGLAWACLGLARAFLCLTLDSQDSGLQEPPRALVRAPRA